MSNQSQGTVLAGQPVAVTAGTGITIDPNTGVISVDASSVTGLVKLNNLTAYNAYQWPNSAGTNGQFLQTNGAGILTWAEAKGFAVVTVQSGAPSPADIGELWFDCATGTLNVYQNCVGTPSPNWFNVAQPGLPVLPANTSAAPPFATGTGTQADPYDCTVTSVGAGTTVQILNTVTVTSLAPFQYVPIIDLNAVANGGRFSFTNNYADAGGNLTFDIVFTDLPPSTPGTPFTALIKIGYGSAYVESRVNVVAPLTLPAGTITGTPTVGTAVAYTPGVATGGSGGYSYTYQWYADGVAIGGATSAAFTPTSAQAGKTLSVTQTVTDSSLSTANATTTASAATGYSPIPTTTWSPGNAMNNSVPGTSNATWNGTTGPVTSDGCVVVSTDGTNWSQSVTATNGQPLYVQWDMAVANTCGLAASGTLLQGKVTTAAGQNSYSVTVNRKPNPALPNVSDTNVALGATVSKSLGTTVQGINTTAYITLGAASTGTNVRVSLDGGTTFAVVPSAPSTSMPVTSGQTIIIEQTVGSTVNTSPGYTAIINVGDSTGSGGGAATFQTVTYTATTVATATFPGVTFTPVGGPNAAPETVTGVAGGGTLGTLEGFAPSNAWPAGLGTTLSSPGGTPTMKMRVGAAAYATSGVAVAAGQTLDLAWNQAYLDTVTSGNTATGTIQGTVGGTTYTNTFTMTVVRAAVFSTTTGSASGAAGAITLPLQTPNQYNVPVKLYQTAPGSNALTSVTVDINTTGAVPLPTTVGSALTLKPGDSVVFAATAPAGTNTYTTQIHIGDTVQTWSYQVTVTPTVTTPVISLPVNTSPLNPASNSPAGLTFATAASGSAGGFQTNYSGTQTAADWYVYKAIATNPTTSAITGTATAPNYTPNLSGSSTSGGTLQNAANAFDGSLSTYADVTPFGGVGTVTTITFTPTTPITATTGRILCYQPQTSGFGSRGQAAVSINGGAFVNTGTSNAAAWFDFSAQITGGQITSIVYQVTCTQGNIGNSVYAYEANGVVLISGAVTLTLTDATDLADMVVGDTVVEVGGGADASGTITAINSGSAPYTLTLSPSTGTWNTGSTAKDTSRTVIPPAPTVLPPATPDATKYTPITGFNPLNITSGTFNQAFIPQASLSTSSKYYASVIYTGSPSGGSPVVSTASAWYSLDTASSFLPAPGTAMGGGYFGGQINDGGIVYNLIVAPRVSGQSSSFVDWKTSLSADTSPSAAFWQNTTYGFPASQAGNSATYPAFQFARGLSISGYSDWYIPAKNELEVLYYFLKPDTTANDTTGGSNPNAVSPEPISTNYTAGSPAQTTATAFRAGGTEAFSQMQPTWSASQGTGNQAYAFAQGMTAGGQYEYSKTNFYSARAIRREYANAPVAIGAAFGGGFFAGQYQDGGITYNLIVAPVATGENSGVSYKTTSSGDTNPNSQNTVYGKLATDQFNDANHPAFQWAKGLTIATFNDWYVPAKGELAIICSNLGPNWTTASAFKSGTGAEALTASFYWSASEDSSGATNAWAQNPDTYNTASSFKTTSYRVRAVRRVVA